MPVTIVAHPAGEHRPQALRPHGARRRSRACLAGLLLALAAAGLAACREEAPTGAEVPPARPAASAATAGLPHLVSATAVSAVSGQWKQATVACPAGEHPTGGGYFFPSEGSLTGLMVSRNHPYTDGGTTPVGWVVKLRPVGTLNSVSGKWFVFATCVPAR